MPSRKQYDELDLRRQRQVQNQIDAINRLLAQLNECHKGFRRLTAACAEMSDVLDIIAETQRNVETARTVGMPVDEPDQTSA